MTTPQIHFTWADAWILLSIIYASRETGRATLRDIIAVADGIEHAVLNHGELDEGLARLIEAGHISRDGVDFRATDAVISAYAALSKRVPAVRGQLQELVQFVGAEPWSPSYRPLAAGSGRIVSRHDYDAAVRGYTGKLR